MTESKQRFVETTEETNRVDRPGGGNRRGVSALAGDSVVSVPAHIFDLQIPLTGLLLQQLVERGLRVVDHQPLGGASSLAFTLWRSFLGHCGTLREVPRPGVGPGRLVKPPACKAGLSNQFQHRGTSFSRLIPPRSLLVAPGLRQSRLRKFPTVSSALERVFSSVAATCEHRREP
jgi:hypothetical protein